MDNKDSYSTEIIRYNIPSDQAEGFEKAYQQAGTYLESSPFCLGYNILQGDEEPNRYILTIYWTSKEDHLDKCRKSDLFTHFFNLVKPYYNQIEEMKHYQKTAISWSKHQTDQ